MPAQAAVYLPHHDVDLASVAPWLLVLSGPGAEHFDCLVDGDAVRFNVMPAADLTRHLQGMCGWLATQDVPAEDLPLLEAAVMQTRTALGLETDLEFDDNHRVWECLFAIADRYDGLVFVHSSLLLPGGEAICGPLRDGVTG
ncbi:hypothetical protein OHA72_49945 [Dactylosporangium sp. NBC_01737]|uniref:hypothetical protein n=1 Tax=Dactylosporangium sp. NBC_01737 TaxID=2975959 RepID=UPI002E114DF8|nr:hypothetical protein OHA72_49945 [Dactylosporangium sp. NBC_01737]